MGKLNLIRNASFCETYRLSVAANHSVVRTPSDIDNFPDVSMPCIGDGKITDMVVQSRNLRILLALVANVE